MYVYIYTYAKYLYMYVDIYIYIRTYVHIGIHTIYINICMYIYTYLYTYVYLCILHIQDVEGTQLKVAAYRKAGLEVEMLTTTTLHFPLFQLECGEIINVLSSLSQPNIY